MYPITCHNSVAPTTAFTSHMERENDWAVNNFREHNKEADASVPRVGSKLTQTNTRDKILTGIIHDYNMKKFGAEMAQKTLGAKTTQGKIRPPPALGPVIK